MKYSIIVLLGQCQRTRNGTTHRTCHNQSFKNSRLRFCRYSRV